MTTPTAVLRIGSIIHHDGASWTVVEFSGRRLLLRRRNGNDLRQVDTAWLLAHPTTHVSAEPAAPGSAGATLGDLGAEQAEQMRVQVEHLQELLTGYRHGDASLAQPGEPRPQYQPTVSKMQRYSAKAAEMGVGVSTLRRWVAAFQAHGPQGLLVGWSLRRHTPFGNTDSRWVDACRTVLAAHVNGSRPYPRVGAGAG